MTDACYPHIHMHFYVLGDGTLLAHQWKRNQADAWLARRPGERADLPAGVIIPSPHTVPAGSATYGVGVVLEREEWERLLAEIPVKSTNIRDYFAG